MLSQGQVIDRYAVQALIGQGGMATVYRVRHLHLGTDRALKVMSLLHPAIRGRLLQEGRLQASLSHPHVVGVSDVLDVGGSPALLMELVAGPSLEQWLARHRPSLDEALALFRDVLAGVAYAHERGLVHRDLKPANVLVVRQGQALVAKVADFGLAKVVEDELGNSGATRTGTGMGTPAYMSPEQIRDAKRVDQRADVFALGCILYELCCGRRAFAGEDLLTLLSAIVAGDYPPPRSLRADLPREVEATILGCLVPDREARLPSCAAILESLPPASPPRWSAPALAAAAPPAEQALPVAAAADTAPSAGAGPARSSPGSHPTAAPGTSLPARAGSGAAETSSETWFPSPGPGPDGGVAGAGTMVPDVEPSPPAEGLARPRSGRWLAALALAVLVGAGALWAVRRVPAPASQGPQSPPPAAASVREEPAPPAPAPALAPPEGAEATAEASPTDPPITEVPATPAAAVAPAPPAAPAQEAPPAEPAAHEAPAAAVAPAPDDAPTGAVRVTGDARSVTLRGAAGTFAPGPVPAGTYDITATFEGRPPAAAGQVTVPAGKEIELRCTSAFVKCVP